MKKIENVSTICPTCFHCYKGHTNIFGKICIKCNTYIPPDQELPIVTNNRDNFLIMKKKVLKYLKNKLGDNDASKK